MQVLAPCFPVSARIIPAPVLIILHIRESLDKVLDIAAIHVLWDFVRRFPDFLFGYEVKSECGIHISSGNY
ncbi:hypothetical protein SAMN05216316_0988 [Nitrosovibrio sp. Nv6]|nr:hypothetical protein SAMN05216316_0988 [Nitrosovibrio sp. Nv6]